MRLFEDPIRKLSEIVNLFGVIPPSSKLCTIQGSKHLILVDLPIPTLLNKKFEIHRCEKKPENRMPWIIDMDQARAVSSSLIGPECQVFKIEVDCNDPSKVLQLQYKSKWGEIWFVQGVLYCSSIQEIQGFQTELEKFDEHFPV